MKKVIKPVYYCDHCNKRGLSASAMTKHEKYCTANPNRQCRLCELTEGSVTPNLKEIIELFKKTFHITEIDHDGGGKSYFFHWDKKVTPKDILDMVDGCPACALTIVRLSGLAGPEVPRNEFDFDYKKSIEEFWNKRNSEEWERERIQMAGGIY